jgi:hypothetical protein
LITNMTKGKSAISKARITKRNGKKSKTVLRIKSRKQAQLPQAMFGPLSTISTAPVAIGNSVRGCSSKVTNISNGVRVCGRDFMFTPIGSGSVATWTLVGGTPITPAAFSDSVLRQYLQMYQHFRWINITAHYITSSPTSSNGDIMFYRGKNRNSVFLSQTSSNLLPFVMSDPDTVIGPQWTNHSVALTLEGNRLSTDYGMSSNPDLYAEGDLYLLSRTTTTDSPGYVIFDYEVEFTDLQISPRLLTLPITRVQWFNLGVGGSGFGYTANSGLSIAPYGNNLTGTASALPTGAATGDIYKVIVDLTNSSTVPAAISTVKVLMFTVPSNEYESISLVDGSTIYAVNYSGSLIFYVNAESAYTNASGGTLLYSASGSQTLTLQLWISLIGTTVAANVNPNF